MHKSLIKRIPSNFIVIPPTNFPPTFMCSLYQPTEHTQCCVFVHLNMIIFWGMIGFSETMSLNITSSYLHQYLSVANVSSVKNRTSRSSPSSMLQSCTHKSCENPVLICQSCLLYDISQYYQFSFFSKKLFQNMFACILVCIFMYQLVPSPISRNQKRMPNFQAQYRKLGKFYQLLLKLFVNLCHQTVSLMIK